MRCPTAYCRDEKKESEKAPYRFVSKIRMHVCIRLTVVILSLVVISFGSQQRISWFAFKIYTTDQKGRGGVREGLRYAFTTKSPST